MALGLTASAQANYIKRFCKGNLNLYVKECDSAGTALTAADGTIWQALGIAKGTTVELVTSEYSDTDDSGRKVIDEETIESYDINTTLMQRDENTRQIHQNVAGRYYQVVLQGQTIGTLVEVWAFAPVKISPKFSYNIGDTAQFSSINLSTISNTASISVTLPTTVSSLTTPLTIGISAMAVTDDVVSA
jgi:hypothetical protein